MTASATLLANEPVRIDGLQSLGDTRHHLVESESLDKRYHVLVGLPDGYDDNADRSYPTVYILDGGALYPLFRSYAGYLFNGGDAPELILVAISYGTDDWREGNSRGHDYTARSDEREHWGGAAKFQGFLSDELMPLIESNYRSRPERRIIFGQSLGGQFVLYTAQTKPGLFWGHIASNAVLHRNLPLFLGMQPEAPDAPSHLFVGDAAGDDPQFFEPRQRWIEHWRSQQHLPWRLRVDTLEGHNHFSTPPASFRRGIRWLFAD